MEDVYEFINKNINLDNYCLTIYNMLNDLNTKQKFPYNLLKNDLHEAVEKFETLKLGGSDKITVFTY